MTFALKAARATCVFLLATIGPPLNPTPARATVIPYIPPGERSIDRLARVPHIEPGVLHGYGALAIRQGRALYIADGDAGASGKLRRVEASAAVRAMRWSPDGRWLAYATERALWLVGRAQSTPHLVSLKIAPGDSFSWSPRADVLRVSHQTHLSFLGHDSTDFTYPATSRERIVMEGITRTITPQGADTVAAIDTFPDTVTWSVDGRRLRSYTYRAFLPYVNLRSAREAIVTSVVGDEVRHAGAPGEGGVIRAQSNPGGQIAFARDLANPDGLLYWSGTEVSASVAADGQKLVIGRTGKAPVPLGTMLEHPSWIALAADDSPRFVFVRGPFREAWIAKSLVVCTARSAQCRALAQPAKTIALDPLWRPHAASIALVRAPESGPDAGYGNNFGPRWIDARRLWLQDVDRGTARELRGFGTGVFWPSWSADGNRLMVFREGEIVLGAPDDPHPRVVASGLPKPLEFQDYFLGDHGVLDEADALFAWTRK